MAVEFTNSSPVKTLYKFPNMLQGGGTFVDVLSSLSIGGQFTVQTECKLLGLGFLNNRADGMIREIAVWGAGTTVLASTLVLTSSKFNTVNPFKFPGPPTLTPGITYTIGILIQPGDIWS